MSADMTAFMLLASTGVTLLFQLAMGLNGGGGEVGCGPVDSPFIDSRSGS